MLCYNLIEFETISQLLACNYKIQNFARANCYHSLVSFQAIKKIEFHLKSIAI